MTNTLSTDLLLEPRLWDRIEETDTGCWEWIGPRNVLGYGRVYMRAFTGKVGVYAHRLIYELLVANIPDGLAIDHLCRNTSCVNPEHLDPVTDKVNLARGYSPSALASRATHCPQGHPYAGDNLRMWKGVRLCHICKRSQYTKTIALRGQARKAARAAHTCLDCGASIAHMRANAKFCCARCKQRHRRAA